MATKLSAGKVLADRVEQMRLILQEAATDGQDLGNELMELVELMREAIAERSERWQESDRGTEAVEWVDAVEALADRLIEWGGTGVELTDDLSDFPAEPEYTEP
jgi:hypothetical protein